MRRPTLLWDRSERPRGFGSWHFAEPRKPAVGQVWWDKDDRVTSRFAKIVEERDDGRFVIRRGENGTGSKSTVSAEGFRKRWTPLEWVAL